jgi:hypothetical protein
VTEPADATPDADAVEAAPVAPSLLHLATGALVGFGVAVVVGAGWFLATVGTKSQLIYLAVPLGMAVGYSVNAGSKRGGVGPALVASGLTVVGCAGSFFFISRSSLVRRGYIRLTGNDPDIPLRPSTVLVRDVLRVSLHSNVSAYLYLVVAVVAAAYFGFRGLETSKRSHRH